MKKQKKIILRVAFGITIISVFGFLVSGQSLRSLNQKVDKELKVEKEKVAVQQEKLDALQEQLKDINSTEYMKKVAAELGMYEEDTIVFREKK